MTDRYDRMYTHRQNDGVKFKVKTVHGPQKVILLRELVLSSSLLGSVTRSEKENTMSFHFKVQLTDIHSVLMEISKTLILNINKN